MSNYFSQTRSDIKNVVLKPSPYTNGQCGCLTNGTGIINYFAGGSKPELLSYDAYMSLVDKLDYNSQGQLIWGSINKLDNLSFVWRQYNVTLDFATNRDSEHRVKMRDVMLDSYISGTVTYLLIEKKADNKFGGKHWLVCTGLLNGAYQAIDTYNGQKTEVPVSQVVGYAILKKD